ncbi:MAG: hypothetical protein ABW217_01405 [Polyangiaceae bacterium]
MMTSRLSFAWLIAGLACSASACNTAPQEGGEGTVAITLLDADGILTLAGLDSANTEHIVLKAGEGRIARLPAGLYSVEFTPDVTDEPGMGQLGSGPELIVIAADRVTSLQIDSDFAVDGTPMAAIEVW